MGFKEIPFSQLLSNVVDNRGKTCPTSNVGIALIATNCIRNEILYPTYDNVRYVSEETFSTWFRDHPRPGDILFVNKATPGRVCMVPDPVDFCIAQDMVAVRADPAKIYPKYLFAVLRSSIVQDRIAQMHVGTLIPHFKKGDFDKLLIPMPAHATQQFIGDLYFDLSAKIDLNRRMSATLEAMARALFKSWFMDFDPVRAKMESRETGLPRSLADLFPARLVDSELGEIPEWWDLGCVDDEFRLTMGQSPPGETYNETGEGVPFYQGRADFEVRFPRRRVYCTSPTRFAQKGDTLISVRAPVGDINMAAENCAIGRGVAAGRHKSGSRSYTYQFMRGLEEVFARFEAEGTVFGSISKKDFHAIPCPIVPASTIAAFERVLSPFDDQIEIILHECATLSALRNALLSGLISGQLRVPDDEQLARASS